MIGLITINDNENIGNRLQNYAMMKILSQYDITKNIVRNYGAEDKVTFNTRIILTLRKVIKRICNGLKVVIRHKPYLNYLKRIDNFQKFNLLIDNGEVLSYDTDYNTLNSKYDIFVVGSDQVWNPTAQGNGMYINMLGFTCPEKKIACSPSISIESLSVEQEQVFKMYLTDFKALSCREKQGSKLIESLVGRECKTLIDPTLMLAASEWNKIAKKPAFHDDTKKYLLVYFLGEQTKEYKNVIQEISCKYDLLIVDIYSRDSIYNSCGPAEFLYLIRNCVLVLTDSFHGAVFSYIYNKPLRIFDRKDEKMPMNTRITNLIDVLHLKNVILDDDIEENIMDYSYDYSFLKGEQEKFKQYLDANLLSDKK